MPLSRLLAVIASEAGLAGGGYGLGPLDPVRQLLEVVNQSDNAFIVGGPDTAITFANAGFTSMFGYTLDEVRGHTVSATLSGPHTDMQVVERIKRELLQPGGGRADILLYTKAGRPLWVSVVANPLFDADGTFTGVVGVLADITQTKMHEVLQYKLLHAMEQMYQLGDEQVFVTASIGITLFPLDATEIETLYRNADQALYVAKGKGRNRFSYFTPALQAAAQARARLTTDLRSALSESQFRLVYQPIVELQTGAIHKAEALIRWEHPRRGLVSPIEFIPIAETSGQIVDIGEWVLLQAARQLQHWRAQFDPHFQISVNRSPVQFQRARADRPDWGQQLQALGLPGNCLIVEITEGLLLDASASVGAQLQDLRDAGIQVALDDFGTGYSSLAYVQKFDIDYIKIDRSFVQHLTPQSTNLSLCKAIIVMAHELGMKVVAEGVETGQQRDLLLQAGCDYGQGYLFARPVNAEGLESLLRSAHHHNHGQTTA